MAGASIDIVADVLKRLGKKQIISPNDIDRAKQTYGKNMEELKYYKEKYITTMDKTVKKQEKSSERPRNGSGRENKQDIQAVMERNAKMRDELDTANRKVRELLTRLSSMAGQKLTDNNPDITDLSDPNRPTILADLFRQVYDNEWTHAFEEMEALAEENRIEEIAHIVKEVDKFCTNAQESQLKKMQNYVMDDLASPQVQHPTSPGMAVGDRDTFTEIEKEVVLRQLKDFRKAHAKMSVKGLRSIFQQVYVPSIMRTRKVKASKGLDEFVSKSVELLWLMNVQDPPMQLIWAKPGSKMDKDRFTFYTKRGDVVQQCIWPVVLLHKDGPLMSKGIVQG